MTQGKATKEEAEIIEFDPARASLPPLEPDAETDAGVDHEADIEADTVGAFLMNARRAAGYTIGAISAETKIKSEYVRAIEAGDFDALPATPYAAGFVKVYAQFLALDGDAMAKRFKDEAGPYAPALGVDSGSDTSERIGGAAARFGSIAAACFVLIFVAWMTVQITNNAQTDVAAGDGEDPTTRVTLAEAPAIAPAPRSVSGPRGSDAAAPKVMNLRAGAAPDAPASSGAADDGVIEPRLTGHFSPAYPESCAMRAASIESVRVMFDVSRAGRPVGAKVLSSTNACFDDEALRTIARWRFDPKTVAGAPTIATGKTATLNFRQ
ncbi:MAG: TonB family protein [Pseudomonadota bacterium]